MKYLYMSFRDPEEDINLGVCIVEASNVMEGVKRSHSLKMNPGGEVMMFEMDETEYREEGLEINRLYSRSEMLDLGYEIGG